MNGKILVVDDDLDALFLIKTMLEKEGHTVITYNSPEKALSEFKKKDYDLAILDYVMPRMNGDLLAERLHLVDSKLYFVFITGYSEFSDTMDQVKDINPIILLKPVDKDELISTIDIVLNRVKSDA
jgi:two-component SAPR family response regulator